MFSDDALHSGTDREALTWLPLTPLAGYLHHLWQLVQDSGTRIALAIVSAALAIGLAVADVCETIAQHSIEGFP